MKSLMVGVAAALCSASQVVDWAHDRFASVPGQVVTSASVVQSERPGDVRVIVALQHARGVHTWADHIIDVPELPGFRPFITRIDIIELTKAAKAGPVTWPAPQDVPIVSDGRQVTLKAFVGSVRATVAITGDRERAHGRLVVRYQPCSERLCFRPQADTLSF